MVQGSASRRLSCAAVLTGLCSHRAGRSCSAPVYGAVIVLSPWARSDSHPRAALVRISRRISRVPPRRLSAGMGLAASRSRLCIDVLRSGAAGSVVGARRGLLAGHFTPRSRREGSHRRSARHLSGGGCDGCPRDFREDPQQRPAAAGTSVDESPHLDGPSSRPQVMKSRSRRPAAKKALVPIPRLEATAPRAASCARDETTPGQGLHVLCWCRRSPKTPPYPKSSS